MRLEYLLVTFKEHRTVLAEGKARRVGASRTYPDATTRRLRHHLGGRCHDARGRSDRLDGHVYRASYDRGIQLIFVAETFEPFPCRRDSCARWTVSILLALALLAISGCTRDFLNAPLRDHNSKYSTRPHRHDGRRPG